MNFPNVKILSLILLAVFVISSGIGFSLIKATHFDGLSWGAIQILPAAGTGESENIDITRSFPAQGIKEMEIQVLFEDVSIRPGPDDSVKLHYYGEELLQKVNIEKIFRAYTQNNGRLLTVETLWQRPRITIGRNTRAMKLDVELPASLLENLSINMASGDLGISGLSLDSKLKIELSSGDAELNDLSAEAMHIKTSSGDAELSNLSAKAMHIGTSSGDAELSNLSAKVMDIKTSSGDVNAFNIQAEENIGLRASSGDIEASELNSASVEIETRSGSADLKLRSARLTALSRSGDINLQLEGASEYVGLESTSGEISLTLPASQNFSLEAETISGRIRNAFSSPAKTDKKSVRMSAGSGGPPQIAISTTSGNIELQK